MAVLPQLVGPEHLVEANSLGSLNHNLSRLIGPAIGGFAVAVFGLAGVVVIDAVSFVAAAALIAFIPARASFKASAAQPAHEEGAAEPQPKSAWGRLTSDLRDGILQVRGSQLLIALMIFSLITAVGEGVLGALFVPWTTDVLHGDDVVFATLLSTQAIGGIVGAVLIGRFLRTTAPALMLGAGAVIFGLIDLVLFTYPLVAAVVWPALLGMVIVGVPATAMQVGANTIGQTEVGDAHRGRVLGLWMTIMAIGAIVGTSLGGVLGQVVGIVQMTVIQGTGYVVAGVIVLFVARRAHKLSAVPRAVLEPQPELPFNPEISADAAAFNSEVALASDR
jgi:predicted MFS family arabinose efflux permease